MFVEIMDGHGQGEKRGFGEDTDTLGLNFWIERTK